MQTKLKLFSATLLSVLMPAQILADSASDFSQVKIAPPTGRGIYVGQYEWKKGDIDKLEASTGIKACLGSKDTVIEPDHDGHPIFDVNAAEKQWSEGRIVIAEAYEAIPDPDHMSYKDFTVDKLLKGEFDSQLKRLANQFRQFNKPMFFVTAREPNGIGAKYFGGFGPNGDKSIHWAIENKKGFDQFDPSSFPNASRLYADLGKPTVSDGVERLIAAQRYYYDFFVNRENLKFLTFDTMGWAVYYTPDKVKQELEDLPNNVDKEYAQRLLTNSFDFETFYPGDQYVDWVSINFYTLDFYAKDWQGMQQDFLVPNSYYKLALQHTMNKIDKVAGNKPVFFLELGFPDGKNQDSERAANRIRYFIPEIINNYPKIQAFFMWSNHDSWADYFPYDTLIRPGTRQGNALKDLMQRNRSIFRSCVRFSDGRTHPNC